MKSKEEDVQGEKLAEETLNVINQAVKDAVMFHTRGLLNSGLNIQDVNSISADAAIRVAKALFKKPSGVGSNSSCNCLSNLS